MASADQQMDQGTPVTLEAISDLFDQRLNAHLNPVNAQLSSIVDSLQNANAEIDSLKKQVKQVESLKKQVSSQNAQISLLHKENHALKDHMINMECQSRRDNLQFLGLEEKRGENCEELITAMLGKASINLNPRSIVRAHRLGRFQKERNRPIIVKFFHWKDRELVWNMRHELHTQSDVTVTEDWPAEMLERRKVLFPIYHAAKAEKDPINGNPKNAVKIVKDRLLLNGSMFSTDNLDKLPDHLQPASVSTPSKGNVVAFFTASSPLSNHHPSPFSLDGNTYNCAEQYLMYQKAVRFNDMSTATKILQETNPVKQKGLGKDIAGFKKVVWDNAVPRILLRGLRSKFAQNPHCADFLKATGSKTIIEANPRDSFYGVGKGLRDSALWDQSAWPQDGNLMGKSLETVRSEL